MPETGDDIALIQLALQGRRSAYSVLVSRYQAYVFTIALRYAGNRELAEELAQDVFVKAFRHLPDFKGNSKFSTWLYTIVHTTCLSHLRRKNDPAIYPGDEHIEHWVDNSSQAVHAESLLEQKTQKHLLTEAIGHLPETDGAIITLYYQAEQSLEEISTITGLTPGNVKVRLFRARQKLKEILEKRYTNETVR